MKMIFRDVIKLEISWNWNNGYTTHSRIQPIIEAAKTSKRHWDGVLRWFESRMANGLLEGHNSLIQAAKARARGYRSTKNLITMISIIAGKLDSAYPLEIAKSLHFFN